MNHATSPTPTSPLLTTIEAAAAMNVAKRTIQERVTDGSLACVRIGRAVRFHPDDIADFIERNRRLARGWKKPAALKTNKEGAK